MKKLLNVCSILLLCISVTAQKTYVQGGVNLANISKNNDGETDKNNMLTTFNVGVMHQFGISPFVDLETGLLFGGRGSKTERYFNGNDNYVKSTFHPMYFEVPLNLLLKFPMGTNSNVFLNAGPYAAIGVAGKAKTKTRVLGFESSTEQNIKFTSGDPDEDDAEFDRLKRFDAGLNFGGGVSFKHLILKANYGLGLTKINSTQANNDENEKNKYRTVSFSVGIIF